MITLLTCTRNRPMAFALLEKWIAAQTVRPDKWIVVTDGWEGYQFTMGQTVVKRRPRKSERHSLCENMLTGLRKLGTFDVCAICDDDDYFSPTYLATMLATIDGYDMAGLAECVYFNIRYRQFIRLRNITHAPLGTTCFRPAVLPLVQEIAERGNPYIDYSLWHEWTGSSRLRLAAMPGERPTWVGIKGMPGERGIGLGHYPSGSSDSSLKFLQEWLPAAAYREYATIVYSGNGKAGCP